jgi:hypothetical protein
VDYGLNAVGCESIARIPANRTIAIDDLDAKAIEDRLQAPEPEPWNPGQSSCAAAIAKIM